MKRFVLTVILTTFVGLAVVYGEVEAMKIGYQIRQLSLKKMELVNDTKLLEFQIATLKTPGRLEQWMGNSHVSLTQSRTLRVARVEDPGSIAASAEGSRKGPVQFARLFMGTARADSER